MCSSGSEYVCVGFIFFIAIFHRLERSCECFCCSSWLRAIELLSYPVSICAQRKRAISDARTTIAIFSPALKRPHSTHTLSPKWFLVPSIYTITYTGLRGCTTAFEKHFHLWKLFQMLLPPVLFLIKCTSSIFCFFFSTSELFYSQTKNQKRWWSM